MLNQNERALTEQCAALMPNWAPRPDPQEWREILNKLTEARSVEWQGLGCFTYNSYNRLVFAPSVAGAPEE